MVIKSTMTHEKKRRKPSPHGCTPTTFPWNSISKEDQSKSQRKRDKNQNI